MGCFVRGGKNGMGCFVRGDKNRKGCFVRGSKSLWDVLSGVSKNGLGCFVPGCFVLHSLQNGSILQYVRLSLSYQLSLRPLFGLFLIGRFTRVLLYNGYESDMEILSRASLFVIEVLANRMFFSISSSHVFVRLFLIN